jgi:hypothetical protein
VFTYVEVLLGSRKGNSASPCAPRSHHTNGHSANGHSTNGQSANGHGVHRDALAARNGCATAVNTTKAQLGEELGGDRPPQHGSTDTSQILAEDNGNDSGSLGGAGKGRRGSDLLNRLRDVLRSSGS